MLRNSQRSSSVKSLQAPERGYTQAARVKDLLACESLPFLSHAYDEPARAVINNGRAWLLNDESDNNLTSRESQRLGAASSSGQDLRVDLRAARGDSESRNFGPFDLRSSSVNTQQGR
jgi:hypothetical protein